MKQKINEIYSRSIFSPFHGYPTKIQDKILYTRLKLRYRKNRLRYGEAAPNPFSIIEINPERVSYFVRPRFFRNKSRGPSVFIDGSWDQNIYDEKITYSAKIEERGLFKFKNYILYQSLKNRFNKGVEWKETEFFRKAKQLDKQGR